MTRARSFPGSFDMAAAALLWLLVVGCSQSAFEAGQPLDLEAVSSFPIDDGDHAITAVTDAVLLSEEAVAVLDGVRQVVYLLSDDSTKTAAVRVRLAGAWPLSWMKPAPGRDALHVGRGNSLTCQRYGVYPLLPVAPCDFGATGLAHDDAESSGRGVVLFDENTSTLVAVTPLGRLTMPAGPLGELPAVAFARHVVAIAEPWQRSVRFYDEAGHPTASWRATEEDPETVTAGIVPPPSEHETIGMVPVGDDFLHASYHHSLDQTTLRVLDKRGTVEVEALLPFRLRLLDSWGDHVLAEASLNGRVLVVYHLIK